MYVEVSDGLQSLSPLPQGKRAYAIGGRVALEPSGRSVEDNVSVTLTEV